MTRAPSRAGRNEFGGVYFWPTSHDKRNHACKARNGGLPIARRHAGVRAAAIHQQERKGARRRLQQVPDVTNLFIPDDSQFTTGTLTIVALAIQQADYLANQLSKIAD